MESVLTKLLGNWEASGKLCTCASIIGIFTYTILLDRDFACSCGDQVFHCNVYLFLPVLIIFLLILWNNRSFWRIWRYPCLVPCPSFFCHIFEAFLVGGLWIAFVFFDGDWYICCQNDHSEQQAPLACKPVGKITEKEQAIIADLKNMSRVIGGFLLLLIIFFASLMSLFRCCKCCEKSRKVLYDQLILEEEENVLKEILRKSAKEQLTKEIKDKICGEHWEECFHVARELIKASTKPEICEQEGRQQQQGARATRNQSTTEGETSGAATATRPNTEGETSGAPAEEAKGENIELEHLNTNTV